MVLDAVEEHPGEELLPVPDQHRVLLELLGRHPYQFVNEARGPDLAAVPCDHLIHHTRLQEGIDIVIRPGRQLGNVTPSRSPPPTHARRNLRVECVILFPNTLRDVHLKHLVSGSSQVLPRRLRQPPVRQVAITLRLDVGLHRVHVYIGVRVYSPPVDVVAMKLLVEEEGGDVGELTQVHEEVERVLRGDEAVGEELPSQLDEHAEEVPHGDDKEAKRNAGAGLGQVLRVRLGSC